VGGLTSLVEPVRATAAAEARPWVGTPGVEVTTTATPGAVDVVGIVADGSVVTVLAR